MKTYSITFSYSRDGKSWTQRNTFIKADSSSSAMSQVRSMFPYVKNIRITNVR